MRQLKEDMQSMKEPKVQKFSDTFLQQNVNDWKNIVYQNQLIL